MVENERNPQTLSAHGTPAETSLRQSEERFRLLVESVQDYAIFLLDPEGYISSWNMGARRIKGYADEEIIGKHFSCFYPPEALERNWPLHELTVARAEGRFEDEGWRIRKDGSRFWANVVITALYDEEGQLHGFAKVTRDMTERKRVESLEQAKRQMDEFLAMLSHELRNPLAPIRNAVSIMQGQELRDPTLRWARDVIDRQVEQLSRLVDDLLEVSRITMGKITLKKEPLEIAAIVSRALESSRPWIDARHHRLEVVVPSKPVQVEGDLIRLSQVLLNLLNNAAKYTAEGGAIWLSVTEEGREVLIRVRDSGIGIPSDLLSKVFDLFAQGDRNLDRSEGGLGIGLTLVQHIVRMHGGTVMAYSDGPGRGSEFVIRLPLLEPRLSDTSLRGTNNDTATQANARRVLVVDDNFDSAQSMVLLLQLWGDEVHRAHDGPTALKNATECRPHVVLLDLGLPGLNGYEVAQRLRANPDMADVRLVAVTGYGRDEDRQRTRAAGFDDHLVKPVNPTTLKAVFAGLLGPASAG